MKTDELTHIHFKTNIARELLSFLINEPMIGEGIYRCVYPWEPCNKHVVKIEPGSTFNNVTEWNVWEAVRFTQHSKWFAPCMEISPNGKVLVQMRTKPITRARLPKYVPAYFTDLKLSNWGILHGRPVCHDYGCNLMLENGITNRMRKANWRD